MQSMKYKRNLVLFMLQSIAQARVILAEYSVGRLPHPLDAFKLIINLNLVGTFNVMRIAAELMDKNEPGTSGDKGVIVNTASVDWLRRSNWSICL